MLEDLARDGKKYKWEKPSLCPCCKNSKLWGHGFVKSYFENYSRCFWLKRYRCPNCSSILTIKPSGYWKRYQSSVSTIFKTLTHRFSNKKWPPSIPRQRAGHWMKDFISNIKMLIFEGLGDFPPIEILNICFVKDINFLSK